MNKFKQNILINNCDMQIQKFAPQSTHNLLLTTFLPSQQIKHLAFIRIDAPKTIFHNNTELRFVTGLAAATINTVKLYSIYENGTAFEIGSWRLHEDISGIVGWDRIIIVNTGQKVVGLRYESGLLKNAFLISLQFLNLDDQDSCIVYTDKMGYYFMIHVRNYLVLCFSELLTAKYKARVQAGLKVELISEEVRWNQTGKNYIYDMVNVKLINEDIHKIEQIQIIDQTIYFVGHKDKDKILFFIHVHYFFNPIQNMQAISVVPQKDQPPQNCRVLIFHPHARNISREPDFVYYNQKTNICSLKSQQSISEIATFDGKLQIFHQGNSLFPILLWQKQKNKFSLIEKYKTFQQTYQFKTKQIANNSYAETIIYRQGITVLASPTGLFLLTNNGIKEKIHQSIGNIIDFHIGKDMLLIENYQKKYTKLYELTKGPRVDSKPFVTHKKKMFLQNLSDLNAIYSLVIGKKRIQILAVRRGTGSNRLYTLYKQGINQFESILQDVKDYEQATINGQNIVLIQTKTQNSLILFNNQQGFVLEPFTWSGWKMVKRWCQHDYLIAYDQNKTWYFYNISTKKQKKIELIKQKQNQISTFIQFRKLTQDKALRDHDLIQIYFFYNKQIHIWLLNLTIESINLIHVSKSIFEGIPILSNDLLSNFPQSHQKDVYRSITCPQYNLNDQGVRPINNTSNCIIIAAYLYQWKNKTLLIMVNNQQSVFIYKKYFNIEDGGFIFRRINTPLNIVKNFKWAGEKSIVNLGQAIIKFGNILIYKGQLVESIPARSLFRMQGVLWGLLGQGKIRLVHLGNEVYEGFCIRQIQCGISEQLMGIDSTSQYYCVFSRKSFQIFGKDFNSHWKCTLGNQTIVCLRMFEHYIGMSYYDYYCDQEGVNDYNSVRFRFRVYNCATKNKIIQRQKPLDQPILHIRYMAPDKLILVTSSLIFVNVLKNDKTLQLYRTHNFSSKRSFLSAFAYIPDILPPSFGVQGSPGYMLFGGSHGGLGFFVGKWIQEQKLKEQWFEGFRCGIRQVCFFHFSDQRDELLKSLVADQDGNLIILTLKVDHAQKVADIRLGSVVNTFKTKSGNQRAVYCSMTDGSIKLLTAVKLDSNQVSYLDFQKSFCEQLPFYGGFNLRTSRRLLQKYRSGRLISRGNVVDGDILQCFFSLTTTLKTHILISSDMEYSPLKSILPF